MNLTPHLFTLEVDNEFGVLTRITAQIRRQGWNIPGLSVAELPGAETSRLTISLLCPQISAAAVAERLARLDCVRSVESCTSKTHAIAELALFGGVEEAQAVQAGCFAVAPGIFGYSGPKDAVNRIIEQLSPKNITRSGEIALPKGKGQG